MHYANVQPAARLRKQTHQTSMGWTETCSNRRGGHLERNAVWNIKGGRGGSRRGRELQTGEVCSLAPATFIPSSAACAHAKGIAKTPSPRWQCAGSRRRQGAKSIRADWRCEPSALFLLVPLFRRRGTSLFAAPLSGVIDFRLGRASPRRPPLHCTNVPMYLRRVSALKSVEHISAGPLCSRRFMRCRSTWE